VSQSVLERQKNYSEIFPCEGWRLTYFEKRKSKWKKRGGVDGRGKRSQKRKIEKGKKEAHVYALGPVYFLNNRSSKNRQRGWSYGDA